VFSDFAKFDRPPLLHLAFQALDRFQQTGDGRVPRPYSKKDAEKLVEYAKEINNAAKNKVGVVQGQGCGLGTRLSIEDILFVAQWKQLSKILVYGNKNILFSCGSVKGQ